MMCSLSSDDLMFVCSKREAAVFFTGLMSTAAYSSTLSANNVSSQWQFSWPQGFRVTAEAQVTNRPKPSPTKHFAYYKKPVPMQENAKCREKPAQCKYYCITSSVAVFFSFAQGMAQ